MQEHKGIEGLVWASLFCCSVALVSSSGNLARAKLVPDPNPLSVAAELKLSVGQKWRISRQVRCASGALPCKAWVRGGSLAGDSCHQTRGRLARC